MADVKFDITENESSSIWDEGELWSLQGGSATGLTDIFFMSGLSVFSRYLPGFAACKGYFSLQVPVLSAVEFVLNWDEHGNGDFFKKNDYWLICFVWKPTLMKKS